MNYKYDWQPITLPALLYGGERENEITHPLTTTDTVDLRSMSCPNTSFHLKFQKTGNRIILIMCDNFNKNCLTHN